MKEVMGLAGMGGQDTGGLPVAGVGVLRPWEQGRCRAGALQGRVPGLLGDSSDRPMDEMSRECSEGRARGRKPATWETHRGKQCRAHLPAQSRPAQSQFLPELSLPLTYTFSLKPPLPKGPLLPEKDFFLRDGNLFKR